MVSTSKENHTHEQVLQSKLLPHLQCSYGEYKHEPEKMGLGPNRSCILASRRLRGWGAKTTWLIERHRRLTHSTAGIDLQPVSNTPFDRRLAISTIPNGENAILCIRLAVVRAILELLADGCRSAWMDARGTVRMTDETWQ